MQVSFRLKCSIIQSFGWSFKCHAHFGRNRLFGGRLTKSKKNILCIYKMCDRKEWTNYRINAINRRAAINLLVLFDVLRSLLPEREEGGGIF